MPSIMKMFGLAYDETICTWGHFQSYWNPQTKFEYICFFYNGTTGKRLFMVLGAPKKDLNLM